MKKIELLAPAGNLEKAKIALLYGADAVFVGGKTFSLRARASNFERDDLSELVSFAHQRGKKVYVTTNIIPHDEDFQALGDYLSFLENIGVDAIIASSLALIEIAKKHAPNLAIHISTQTSTYNSSALKYWEKKGVSRVVLARELTIKELKEIVPKTPLELEVFIHGGMCAGFSGRCVLSNHMTMRDANRGGCAHSCRWNYYLYQKQDLLPGFFNFGSKDLMAVHFIEDLIKMGIASLKIEGRMKSIYYLATVVRAYRTLIDCYYEKGKISDEDLKEAVIEIAKAENRQTSIGFFGGVPTVNEQLYDNRTETPTKEFVGMVVDYNSETQMALIEQRNYFSAGDEVEFFGPFKKAVTFIVPPFVDYETQEELTVARHPLQKIHMFVPIPLAPYDMLRLVKKENRFD
ncbi:MAG: U32 family peptidase [Bacilli bacterium]|jgi:putative protease|nr:U32 family peptidase [Bacilli bacterium]HHU23966.1 U32 family peptidase [Acholeplasmataceae bacterium]